MSKIASRCLIRAHRDIYLLAAAAFPPHLTVSRFTRESLLCETERGDEGTLASWSLCYRALLFTTRRDNASSLSPSLGRTISRLGYQQKEANHRSTPLHSRLSCHLTCSVDAPSIQQTRLGTQQMYETCSTTSVNSENAERQYRHHRPPAPQRELI